MSSCRKMKKHGNSGQKRDQGSEKIEKKNKVKGGPSKRKRKN